MFDAGDFLSLARKGACSYGHPMCYVRQRYSDPLSEASETVYAMTAVHQDDPQHKSPPLAWFTVRSCKDHQRGDHASP